MANVPTMQEIREASIYAIRYDICQWLLKIASDDRYGYVIFRGNIPATHTCPICKGRKTGHYFGWNCLGLTAAGWHHGGHIPSKCNCGIIDNDLGTKLLKMSTSDILETMRKHLGVDELKIITNGKKHIQQSMLRPADMCIYYSGSTYKHMFTYIGNGRIVHAQGSSGKVSKANQICSAKYFRSGVKIAVRYTGTRSYISMGAKGEAVEKIQAIVGVKADGVYGAKTYEAIKAWQEAHGLAGDGLVGAKTLEAMKKDDKPTPKPPKPKKKGYSGTYPSLKVGKKNKYIRKGEKSDRVVLLKKYLNWYFGKALFKKSNNSFNDTTEKYVKKFQKAQGIKDDGIVGPTTLKKMKGVVK